VTISTYIIRLARVLALGIVAMAFVVPAAQANDRLVDDWFRGAPSAKQAALSSKPVTNRLVDDYFRDANSVTAQTSDGIVDDWFRDGNRVAASAAQTTADRFDWKEFGIGAAAMLGLVLAAGLAIGASTTRRKGGQLGNLLS
jgi:hypothetical protein